MGRLIDADDLKDSINISTSYYSRVSSEEYNKAYAIAKEKMNELKKWIDDRPTVEAIPKDQINKAIEKIEQYICDVETDTVKAQGMAQALDMFEQALKGGKR